MLLRTLCCLFYTLCLLSGCGLLAHDEDAGASAADSSENDPEEWQGNPVPYTVKIEVRDGPASLKDKMEDLSQLVQLRRQPPDSQLALERRGRLDQETAIKLLHSQCYYDGDATLDIDEKVSPAEVTLTLIPGPIFTVGSAKVEYRPEPVIPEAFKNREQSVGLFGWSKEKIPPPQFPTTLPGVTIGEPIIADDMLKAVENLPENLRKNGYPLAKVVSAQYTLDKAKRHLDALVILDPGPPALLGPVVFEGNTEVNSAYLRKLMPWDPGTEPWNENLLEDYANTLRGLGVFRSVSVRPMPENLEADDEESREGVAILPALVEIEPGPPRTVGFSARYDTSNGFGVEGRWEHRNLFHNGERLTVSAPLSQEESGIKAHFEKPAFPDRKTFLFADGAALWENKAAYHQEGGHAELGLRRYLARRWWGGLSIYAEGGQLKDGEHDPKAYGVLSPRAGLVYDGRNNRFNPSSGMQMQLQLEPFSGYYEQEFAALAGKASIAGFYAPLGRMPDGKINDKIVLAARAEAGAMPVSTSLDTIPSSLRYYAGGAGSVRGYAYQAIGPRNKDGDPLGGRSYQVVNLEARYMVTDDIGIVPFLDGGMVFREKLPKIFSDMDWGPGLGFRYYTPIGPVRLDVATPLHRIDGDPPIQFYISIGQSF